MKTPIQTAIEEMTLVITEYKERLLETEEKIKSTTYKKNNQRLKTKAVQFRIFINEMKKNRINLESLIAKEQELILDCAKYGYDYRATTSFPNKSFEENCKNNFLQYIK